MTTQPEILVQDIDHLGIIAGIIHEMGLVEEIDRQEKLQAEHPDYRMELVDENIIVMSPSGYESDEVALEFGAQLRNWVRPRKLGRVTGSSGGAEVSPSGETSLVIQTMSLLSRSYQGLPIIVKADQK
jgi:hypothetical protein